MTEGLVDRVYECAFTPDGWPGVLDEISHIAGARGGSLLTANGQVLNWTASASMGGVWEALSRHGLMACGERFRRLVGLGHSGFLTELDGYGGEDEMAADPLYREVLWPLGLGWAAATALPLPTGDTLVLTFERDRDSGPAPRAVLEQLDRLRPHLARSALLSARLQLERAGTTSDTLALLGVPALVFDQQGRVLATNAPMEALSGPVRWRARERVAFSDPAADTLLQQALAGVSGSDAPASASVRSFAVRATEADKDPGPAMVAHVTPIRGEGRDLFVRCAGVLVLTPVTMPDAPPLELVQSLFDLTPAEARVARRLSAGETVDEIAAASGLAPITVRNQVRGILRKTGCRRQAEVVALLGGISSLH